MIIISSTKSFWALAAVLGERDFHTKAMPSAQRSSLHLPQLRIGIEDACPTQLRVHHLRLCFLLSVSYKIPGAIMW